MANRDYNMYCATARAFEVLGEPWTPLIVRELITGQKRFKDLLEGLPGVSSNLLTQRLKGLVARGIVERQELPPPASATAYGLTELGRGLEPVLFAAARWGSALLGRPRRGEIFKPNWAVLGMRAAFSPEKARGLDETWEYRVDGDVFHVRIKDGAAHPDYGPAPTEPDMVVTCGTSVFLDLVTGALYIGAAIEAGKLEVKGGRRRLDRSLAVFGIR